MDRSSSSTTRTRSSTSLAASTSSTRSSCPAPTSTRATRWASHLHRRTLRNTCPQPKPARAPSATPCTGRRHRLPCHVPARADRPRAAAEDAPLPQPPRRRLCRQPIGSHAARALAAAPSGCGRARLLLEHGVEGMFRRTDHSHGYYKEGDLHNRAAPPPCCALTLDAPLRQPPVGRVAMLRDGLRAAARRPAERRPRAADAAPAPPPLATPPPLLPPTAAGRVAAPALAGALLTVSTERAMPSNRSLTPRHLRPRWRARAIRSSSAASTSASARRAADERRGGRRGGRGARRRRTSPMVAVAAGRGLWAAVGATGDAFLCVFPCLALARVDGSGGGGGFVSAAVGNLSLFLLDQAGSVHAAAADSAHGQRGGEAAAAAATMELPRLGALVRLEGALVGERVADLAASAHAVLAVGEGGALFGWGLLADAMVSGGGGGGAGRARRQPVRLQMPAGEAAARVAVSETHAPRTPAAAAASSAPRCRGLRRRSPTRRRSAAATGGGGAVRLRARARTRRRAARVGGGGGRPLLSRGARRRAPPRRAALLGKRPPGAGGAQSRAAGDERAAVWAVGAPLPPRHLPARVGERRARTRAHRRWRAPLVAPRRRAARAPGHARARARLGDRRGPHRRPRRVASLRRARAAAAAARGAAARDAAPFPRPVLTRGSNIGIAQSSPPAPTPSPYRCATPIARLLARRAGRPPHRAARARSPARPTATRGSDSPHRPPPPAARRAACRRRSSSAARAAASTASADCSPATRASSCRARCATETARGARLRPWWSYPTLSAFSAAMGDGAAAGGGGAGGVSPAAVGHSRRFVGRPRRRRADGVAARRERLACRPSPAGAARPPRPRARLRPRPPAGRPPAARRCARCGARSSAAPTARPPPRAPPPPTTTPSSAARTRCGYASSSARCRRRSSASRNGRRPPRAATCAARGARLLRLPPARALRAAAAEPALLPPAPTPTAAPPWLARFFEEFNEELVHLLDGDERFRFG